MLEAQIGRILRSDPFRWHLLGVVSALDLPDCWIAAGFVRNAVWDHLHRSAFSRPPGDVDVIWYDRSRADRSEDKRLEATLIKIEPSIAWSVKNQARMHHRNGDPPYPSAVEAMLYWPETATAVAARRHRFEDCQIAAPLGLDDLSGLILRPGPHFAGDKRSIYEDRVRSKGWLASWPMLRMADA